MTPAEYITQLGDLVGAGRDEEALAFAQQHGPTVTPRLSPAEFFHVSSLMEGAQMAVDVTAAVSAPCTTRGLNDYGGPIEEAPTIGNRAAIRSAALDGRWWKWAGAADRASVPSALGLR